MSKCKFPNCGKRPSFNLPGIRPAIYCKDHKQENMIDVVNSKCIFEGCCTVPIYIETRLNLLVKTIKTQLVKIPNKFSIKLIQLFYDDDYLEYKPVKKENITKLVSI